jgi:hypothetical protein
MNMEPITTKNVHEAELDMMRFRKNPDAKMRYLLFSLFSRFRSRVYSPRRSVDREQQEHSPGLD